MWCVRGEFGRPLGIMLLRHTDCSQNMVSWNSSADRADPGTHQRIQPIRRIRCQQLQDRPSPTHAQEADFLLPPSRPGTGRLLEPPSPYSRPAPETEFARPPVRPPARPSVRPSVHPPVCLSVRPSIRLPARPSAHPSVHPSVRPSVRLPVRPSARPSFRPSSKK